MIATGPCLTRTFGLDDPSTFRLGSMIQAARAKPMSAIPSCSRRRTFPSKEAEAVAVRMSGRPARARTRTCRSEPSLRTTASN
jgi:hypothetical protein